MARELGGSQISALLESVPGIANVLRSPVADALVNMIRAGAGLGDFRMDDVKELVQYAVRRGLISVAEGEELLLDVKAVAGERRARASRAGPKRKARATKRKKPRPTAKKKTKKAAKKKVPTRVKRR
ncbi:MAG: hypothetical protein GTN78_20710 [Gemmatimonadales bacterium]|nr:hypothetical protein [Gemmatimonadales bacterium]NIN10105.1 hypothetical protein [Gemmatimonadales bacterium]NIR02589.1 hypothetical protein [Gemmatimonadales bacterium]NIS66283.1 hypothetical protein [Gemmatimonadales bacterium]